MQFEVHSRPSKTYKEERRSKSPLLGSSGFTYTSSTDRSVLRDITSCIHLGKLEQNVRV